VLPGGRPARQLVAKGAAVRFANLFSLGLALLATTAVGQEGPSAASPSDAAGETAVAPMPHAGPQAGDFRWQLMGSFGGGASGAPNAILGGGVALGAVRGVRVEANALLGWSARREAVPVQPSWNDDFWTFTSAGSSARNVLLELTGSRKVDRVELWAGGGVHVSFVQFEATYDSTRCTDLLCLGPTYRTTDTDAKVGSGAVGALLSAGVRYPVVDHLLLGLDVRYLFPATSRVQDRYDVAARLGGFAASAGLVVRFGAPVPR
jgi:hypothetical protein